MTDCKNF